MDTGRAERLSIAISVLFHALVLAGLALGLGGTGAGPVNRYMSVELFEPPGGAQPPGGDRAHAPEPVRMPASPPVRREPVRPRAVVAEAPAFEEVREEEVQQSEEPEPQEANSADSDMSDITLTDTDGQDLMLSDLTGTSQSPGVLEADTDGGGEDGLTGELVAVREVRIGEIRTAIQSSVVYPPVARRRGLEGTVLASFIVDDKGVPHDVQVVESSGHGIFDREVVRVIHAASPYPLVDIAVEVPVTFRLSSLTSR